MQTGIDVSVAVLAWAVTFYKFNAVWKDSRRTRDWRVLGSWAFALFFALCMTFQVDAVYFTIDTFVGVNNLSWLLAYLCLVLAICFVCVGCCTAIRIEQPRWMLPYLVVTAALLVAIFSLDIATAPEWADHDIPRTVAELLFMELLYIYGSVMGMIPALVFTQIRRNEGTLSTRLRVSVILLAIVLAIIFFLVKIAMSFLGFLYPSRPLVFHLLDLARLLMAASGLLWVLVFVPNGFYLAVARPFMFREKILALRDLRYLQVRLNRLCPPVVPDRATCWDRLRNLDFYIYRAVIGILDGKKMLAAHLNALEARQTQIGLGQSTLPLAGRGASGAVGSAPPLTRRVASGAVGSSADSPASGRIGVRLASLLSTRQGTVGQPRPRARTRSMALRRNAIGSARHGEQHLDSEHEGAAADGRLAFRAEPPNQQAADRGEGRIRRTATDSASRVSGQRSTLMWDDQALEEATQLHQALQDTPEPQDFDGLAAAYQGLSRRLQLEVR